MPSGTEVSRWPAENDWTCFFVSLGIFVVLSIRSPRVISAWSEMKCANNNGSTFSAVLRNWRNLFVDHRIAVLHVKTLFPFFSAQRRSEIEGNGQGKHHLCIRKMHSFETGLLARRFRRCHSNVCWMRTQCSQLQRISMYSVHHLRLSLILSTLHCVSF